MVIASLRLEFRLRREVGPWRKRRLVRSILKQLHRRFNVAVAEVEKPDHPLECVVVVVAVGAGRREVRALLHEVVKACSAHPKAELIGQSLVEV
ncbi:MAG: DUF503 family protein [Acidobacteria bacterium]|nr:DUF503 family protein [Acidobacteriota bacterium]